MSQQSWGLIYRLSGIVLLLAIMGLVLQVQYVGWMTIMVTAVISGLTCLLAYKRKSDGGDTIDFGVMLDTRAAASSKAAQAGAAGTVATELLVVGVVQCIGASGIGKKLNAYFVLNPWRVKGGAVQEIDLTIRLPKPVSQSEYDRFALNLAADDLIAEVKITDLAAGNGNDSSTAQLVEIVSIGVVDSELSSLASQKHLPVELELDGQPVRFAIDEEEGIYAGTIQWLGNPIRLYLDTDDSRQTRLFAKDAKVLLANTHAWDTKLREKLAGLLVEENRDLLNPEDRDKPTEAILARLSLNDIHVMEEGVLTFNFSQDNVFPDKEISIFGDLEQGLEEAELY